MGETLDRRQFLGTGALAAAGACASLLRVPAVAQHLRPYALKKPIRPRKVIVVGAGLAGLSAAYELTRAGHDVTVIEAQMRPGGRVLTARTPFADGLYAELGAARIPDNHALTLHYAREFGLELAPFTPSTLDDVRVIRGRRIRVPRGRQVDITEFPVEVTPHERSIGLRAAIGEAIGDLFEQVGRPADPGWPPPRMRQLDDISWKDFLASRGLSPGAIEIAGIGHGPGDDTSALWVARLIALQRDETTRFKIVGGSDRLPAAFASRLDDRILYGAPVVRLEHDADEVRAFYDQGGATRSMTGDRLICAIPFSVLRELEVSPRFSPAKHRAIDGMRYGTLSRVLLQVRRRFWEREGLSGWGRTDQPGEIWHSTFDQGGPRGILTSYTRMAASRALASMTGAERIRHTVGQLEPVFPGLREHVEGGVSKCWDEDPWQRGAFARLGPGEFMEVMPHAARPEGRVHFAGEHTSAWHGWMQGALASGDRVAREVMGDG